MIEKMMLFLKQAGEIALNNQREIDKSPSYLKGGSDDTIVTKTDQEISALFKKFMENYFADLDYLIIDEESALQEKDIFEKAEKSEYQFVIDPIDGTLPYAMKMPLFGILVGILKKGKPYMGFIYTPATKEIVYSDGGGVYWIQNAFEDQETKTRVVKSEKEPMFVNLTWRVTQNGTFNLKKSRPVNVYAFVISFLYQATNRFKATYFEACLWDMAGAWAILKNLGYEFFNIETGEILEKFDRTHFNSKLIIDTVYIACRPKDFELYKSIVTLSDNRWI
ncbi:MAG: hypothetical protein LBU87_04630 [Lactobacillales bacterium]|nr:hypothetical protein [Lactobacillales bacterium]